MPSVPSSWPSSPRSSSLSAARICSFDTMGMTEMGDVSLLLLPLPLPPEPSDDASAGAKVGARAGGGVGGVVRGSNSVAWCGDENDEAASDGGCSIACAGSSASAARSDVSPRRKERVSGGWVLVEEWVVVVVLTQRSCRESDARTAREVQQQQWW